MKGKVSQIIGWVFGIGALFVYFFYFFDLDNAKLVLADVSLVTILLSVVCGLIGYLIKAFKWTYILRCQDKISWGHGFHTIMASNMASFAFPVRIGEFLKPLIAKKTAGVSFSSSTAATLVDNFSLMFFILLCLFLTPFAEFELPQWALRVTPIFYTFMIISIIIFVLGVSFSGLFKKGIKAVISLMNIDQAKTENLFKGKYFGFFEDTLKQCHITAFRKRDFLIIVFLSVITIFFDSFVYYLLITAFGLSFTWFKSIIAACFFYVILWLPSPPGKVGTAEIFPILIFSGVFHFPSNVISIIAVLLHAITALIIIAPGIYSTLSLGMRLKTLLNFSSDNQQEIKEQQGQLPVQAEVR